MNNRSGLIVFAKKPLLGEVKTRLQPHLTPETSLQIYRSFVEETLEKVSGLSDTSVWLGCFPNKEDPWLFGLSQRFSLRLFNQEGENLGIRMERAFGFLNREKIGRKVIIGTDSPHLPLSYIRSAFEFLKKTEVVIGPSRDGGYYLLGISGNPPSLFDGISWSTDTVLKSTIRKLEESQISYKLLPEWFDIDYFGDLQSLYAYWVTLKNNGGKIPEKSFKILDSLEQVRKRGSHESKE